MFHSQEITGAIRPVQDYLVLRPIKEEAKQRGVFIPDAARSYGRCPVVAAGPDCQLGPCDCVYIQRFVEGEFKFQLNGEAVYAIRERHVNVAMNVGRGPGGAPLKAVADRILVRRIKEPEQVRGGIFIPETAQEKTQRCEVVSVGGGMCAGKRHVFQVKPGDLVLIAKYTGTEVKIDGEAFTVINEGDVIGVLEENVDTPTRQPKRHLTRPPARRK